MKAFIILQLLFFSNPGIACADGNAHATYVSGDPRLNWESGLSFFVLLYLKPEIAKNSNSAYALSQ